MMNDLYGNFPDDFATNAEKDNLSFGKEVGKAAASLWYNGKLSARRKWITEMRQYSRGEQMTNYKEMIEGSRKNGKMDMKTHKIDYDRKLKTLAVFKDIVTNQIDESLFKPRAEAVNRIAVNKKKDYFKKLDDDFYTKDIASLISGATGVDLGTDNMPKDEQDLKVKKLEYKPDIEIAQELAIENVMKHQKFEVVKDRMDEDLFNLGFAVGRHYTDNTEGIKLKYVDPYNYIHTSFEMEDGRDIRLHGELNEDTISNLAKMAGGFSEEQYLALKKLALGRDKVETYNDKEDGNRLIEYIYFAYELPKSKIFKKLRKNKITKLIDRTLDGYEPTNKNKKVEIPFNTWYEGMYIPQADIIVKWSEMENQVEDNINNPVSPFVVYAPNVKRLSETGTTRFDSMVERAIPIVDDIQRDWYKFQQLKMELRPNTTEIDVDAIQNVALNGQKLDPKDVLDLFFGRGLLLKQKYDEDGDVIENAVRESPSSVNYNAIQFLSTEFTNNYNRLRQLLGINELRDGTTQTNTRMSATVQKLLLASSNNATNHIVKASFSMSLMFSQAVSYRLYDVLKEPSLKSMYMDVIGTTNVELLDAIKEIPMHKFGIYFDFKPDNEERLAFEQSLVNALNGQEINSAQYNKARQIRNVKNAIRYIEIVIEENIEKKEQAKLQNIQAQAQANAQSTVVAERAKQATELQKWNLIKQELLLKDQLEERKDRRNALKDDILAERKHRRTMEIEEKKLQASMSLNQYKEDKKDDRINQVATNTSAIVDQKVNQKPAIDFKNQIDDIFSSTSLIDNQPPLSEQLSETPTNTGVQEQITEVETNI
ncbi:structural protein/portal protein [Tenacibaculum phage Gundel_1]|uniref:Structural protein/portal protein n=1 Tax=Tenacibaculum phage Gundel_1 TaxID=2745672 RepID=A0A8E4ZDI7_9CAUD|nr:structural protein/portal protein [Tenacibaculum phage Gundel_1]QQV91513.1 structural protein/portal protein [Tenacibaculum phage Gundel_1]